jgi:hypothetical protein
MAEVRIHPSWIDFHTQSYSPTTGLVLNIHHIGHSMLATSIDWVPCYCQSDRNYVNTESSCLANYDPFSIIDLQFGNQHIELDFHYDKCLRITVVDLPLQHTQTAIAITIATHYSGTVYKPTVPKDITVIEIVECPKHQSTDCSNCRDQKSDPIYNRSDAKERSEISLDLNNAASNDSQVSDYPYNAWRIVTDTSSRKSCLQYLNQYTEFDRHGELTCPIIYDPLECTPIKNTVLDQALTHNDFRKKFCDNARRTTQSRIPWQCYLA